MLFIKGRGSNERNVEMATTPDKQDKLCDNLVLVFFGRRAQRQKGQPFDNPNSVKITLLPIFQIPLIYELRRENWLPA